MSRPRKPTALKAVNGSFDNHPERENKNEPKDNRSVGDAPDYLSPMEVQCWNDLVENSIDGVLTQADRTSLEFAARLWSKSKLDFAEFKSSDMGVLIKLLSQFGMTPADRSKLSIETKKPAKKEGFAAFNQ